MKIVKAEVITDIVKRMCIDANINLAEDTYCSLKNAGANETSETGRDILDKLVVNADLARELDIPICQDTGYAVFFIEVGQDVRVKGNLTEAVNEGVRQGYKDGYLRKSVVVDPLVRINTDDNTPAIIHYDIVPGDKIKITFTPKGFGSENKSKIKMLNPSDGYEGVVDFVLETIKLAGGNPCPPMVIGVCVGGDFEKAAILSKKALTLGIGVYNDKELYRNLQDELLEKINQTNIGPSGLGGKTTALWVNVIDHPTHIAGLPVAVNVCCHAARHVTEEI